MQIEDNFIHQSIKYVNNFAKNQILNTTMKCNVLPAYITGAQKGFIYNMISSSQQLPFGFQYFLFQIHSI